MKINNIELLSPVGDFDCLKAAVQSGADCVYFGANLFNARASATNFNDEELKKAIEYAKFRNVKTNLALNILIKNDEFNDAIQLATKAYKYGIDAIIVQDLGLAMKLIELFPDLPIHASTQITVHNLEGVLEAEKLGFKRVVLSRELNIDEIKYICDNSNIEIETFIHGALCISYSGQCLLSSMIGARSGNRGKCAQPCRLPYELITSKNKTLDKGYLLSTKDLCSLDLLPILVNLGIKCFKIEGRLKNPEYVATVTRIYRKYIDLALSDKPYIIDEQDKRDLLQVFNRGGFSSGYLNPKPNNNLICKNKPNNMGIYIGKVSNFNKNKGYITAKLEDNIAIGDSVSLEKEKGSYTVSELILVSNSKETNTPYADKSQIVKIGRIKGNINIGDSIYKIGSKKLNNYVKELLNTESKKTDINCILEVHKNTPITMTINTFIDDSSITDNNTLYKELYSNINFTITSDLIPVDSINNPITKERLIEQIDKINTTPFNFKNITVNLDDNLYIPSISKLNQLRRDCIDKLENIVIEKIHRKLNVTNSLNKLEEQNKQNTSIQNEKLINSIQKHNLTNSIKQASILLNILNTNYNYKNLKNINKIYIPLRYFCNNSDDYTNILKDICTNFNAYIYMPSIYKNFNNINIDNILSTYKIKGFVLSNISHFYLLDKYKDTFEFIANYNLNIFNNNTIQELQKLHAHCITISPELDYTCIHNINCNIPTEIIVYGNIPVMTTNYCVLSKSNSCLKKCNNNCAQNNKYYLKDRLNLNFRILPDSFSSTTTIFNTKKLSISSDNLNCNYIRLDFLDEDIDDINEIVELSIDGDFLQGPDYTNGNYNRII